MQGLYFDIDSIKNHLEIERLDADNIFESDEITELEKELNLDKIMKNIKN